ncbi:uncharacterized protein LOC105832457 [Monomorium pharaonis]|uniref:uncharacterized protein LOC105832457 n=1 Tax=Monomorium pharaonis TaxID=307658 RepID=UPI00063FC0E2|nr:uncharacterized protein LOC105832457 [Monomorium pharaonis]XP_012528866.1 uncharacterized protein LOC105832457 [Monomorium pharaonis]
MDLRNDIKKVTSLTSVDHNAKFYRLHGLSQAAKDKKMNERILKKPRNIELIDDSSMDEDSDDCMETINNKVKPPFDKHEVSAAIREVNGGRDLSNKHFEENFWKQLQDEAKSEKKKSQTLSKNDNVETNQSEDLNNKCVKENKLLKNAAIMGLVNTKIISLQDINIFYNNNSAKEKNELKPLHEIAMGVSNECIPDNSEYKVESIPLREDPEIFVHPLQIGINKKQFKDIDFSIPSIAKKKKVTPAGHFLEANDDSHFEFVKKKNSTT